jgi:hypothetical protein
MPFTGQLFKFLLFQTRADEFYLFVCCHHIVIDGFGLALVCQRIASVYSAIVSGAPIAPPIFGSLQDLLDCESEYEASKDYLEDQAYWTANLPAISEPRYRLPEASGESDRYRSSGPVRLDPVVLRRVEQLCQLWNMPRSSVISAACALLVSGWCTTGEEVVLDFPVLVIFALTAILASGATIGTQIGAAIVFILETLAVVEIVLISNLVTPTKTQALLRLLHDWARAYRRQILVAMFTLVGLALVVQGAGGT